MAQAHSRALSELCITMKTQMQVWCVCVSPSLEDTERFRWIAANR